MKYKNSNEDHCWLKQSVFLRLTTIHDDECGDYTPEDLKEGFFVFLDTFGSIACNYQQYNPYNQQLRLFKDCCTTSDEALILFFLDTNWDFWIYDVENPQATEDEKRKKRPNKTGKSNRKFGGWSPTDIYHFNDFCREVFSSRSGRVRLQYEEEYMSKKRTTKKKISIEEPQEPVPIIEPYNDLMDVSQIVTPNMSQETVLEGGSILHSRPYINKEFDVGMCEDSGIGFHEA